MGDNKDTQSSAATVDDIAAIIDPKAFIIPNSKRFEIVDRQRDARTKAAAILALVGEPQTAPQLDPERVARIICRQDVPYNWQGKNRDAWVEIQWKGYLPRANALIADLTASAHSRPEGK